MNNFKQTKALKFVKMKTGLGIDFEEAKKFHRSGGSSFEIARMLTFSLDSFITYIADTLPLDKSYALIATGGYGRVELCPKSDIDIVFLVESKDKKIDILAIDFFQRLWDLGMNIGHSYRTIDECVEIFVKDVESRTALLESRFICGDKDLFDLFIQKVKKESFSEDSDNFIYEIIENNKLRHQRYGNSVKLLEPNVKKSAGGLRDIHTMLWILRIVDPDFWELRGDVSACVSMLKLMADKKMISQEQFISVVEAFEFMLKTRIELHFASEGITDTLDFNLQRKVASGLGYAEKFGEKGVEVFMRDYYLRAREIFNLNKTFISKFESKNENVKFNLVELLDEDFSICDGCRIIFTGKTLTPIAVFKAFLYKSKTGADFDNDLKLAILDSRDKFDYPNAREVDKIFLEIFNSKGEVASTLELMNELGILGRYIPEFGALVGLFQHSVYHYYTVDEHTLKAIRNAEMLEFETSRLGDIFRSLRRKDILYLAILFHDSGKAVKIDGHSEFGAEIAKNFLARINYDAIDDVCFLVKNHLLMEQVAFRRNFYEPGMLFSFASNFDKVELIDMLYVLTYADLSAVNPEVWTSWKAQLLEEIYMLARPVIENKLTIDEIYEFIEESSARRIESIILSLSHKVEREAVENHFENLIEDDSYLASFTDSEISEHISKIAIGGDKKVDVIFSHRDGYTEITVITTDAPFVLASICGVLSANDANIFDAKIFTRKDGIVIDKFRVFDYVSGVELSAEQCRKIERDLNDVFNGLVNLDELFERHRRKWKRKIENTRRDVKIAVEFEDSRDYTVIDVFAPDSLGFLYKVSRKMSELGLNIYFAKIATRTDGIVDSFYVLDVKGHKITDENFKEKIRNEILGVIYELNNLKLTTE